MKPIRKLIYGWGNFPKVKSEVYRPESLSHLQKIVKNSDKILATGNHRSYGDASLNGVTIDMRKLDKFLSFDTKKGILKAESGLLFSEILKVIVPKDWFLPVVPGTKFITLGGAVGSDIHGKNHHNFGSFAVCVKALDIVTADGKIMTCSKTKNKDLFQATLGGQGLTGVVYSVELKLRKIDSSYVDVYYKKCNNLDRICDYLERADSKFDYTVAWIDMFSSNAILIVGNHAEYGELDLKKESSINIPVSFPNFVLNSWTVRIFNLLYFLKHPRGRKRIHYDTFFFPLDGIRNWNKIYGRRGFIQYQCVIPNKEDVKVILGLVSFDCFLAVLKRFDKGREGLSFPKKGYTLALDFPVGRKTKRIVRILNAFVLQKKGRVYLAKDVLTNSEMFKAMYPEFPKWKKIKKKYDPTNKFVSFQARRLDL